MGIKVCICHIMKWWIHPLNFTGTFWFCKLFWWHHRDNETMLPCKTRRQNLLTLHLSGYCILALQSRKQDRHILQVWLQGRLLFLNCIYSSWFWFYSFIRNGQCSNRSRVIIQRLTSILHNLIFFSKFGKTISCVNRDFKWTLSPILPRGQLWIYLRLQCSLYQFI